MDLAGYQMKYGLSVGGLAAHIGVTEQALHRYMHRGRIPQTAVMKRIIAVTGGEVTANDFYLAAPARKRRVAA
jgi:predicted transcriptional regulator